MTDENIKDWITQGFIVLLILGGAFYIIFFEMIPIQMNTMKNCKAICENYNETGIFNLEIYDIGVEESRGIDLICRCGYQEGILRTTVCKECGVRK
jgi:hypothetical protein